MSSDGQTSDINFDETSPIEVLDQLPGSAPDPSEGPAFRKWVEHHRVRLAKPVSKDDVIGVGHVMRETGSLLARLRNPSVMAAAGADMPRGILFYGPPGTGKTLTARYVAGQVGAQVPFYEFSSDEFSPSNVRAIFSVLSRHGNSVIYVDEIDGFAMHRHSDMATNNSRRTLSAMLTALDGLVAKPGILVICSSNTDPERLDPALLRAGRIGFVVAFRRPEEPEREALFRHFASSRHTKGRIDWARAARMTRDRTPADIRQSLDDALGLALAAGRNEVTEDDVFAAVARRGSVEPETTIDAAFWQRTAIHEAGHVAAAVALRGAERVYSVSMSEDGGQTYTDWDKSEATHQTNESIIDQIAISYAGSRAEQMVYGNFALGSHSDHKTASAIIHRLISSGLSEELALLTPSPFNRDDLISDDLRSRAIDVAEKLARRAQALAAAIVGANKIAIDTFASRLVAVAEIEGNLREMSGPDLQAAISECGFRALTGEEASALVIVGAKG